MKKRNKKYRQENGPKLNSEGMTDPAAQSDPGEEIRQNPEYDLVTELQNYFGKGDSEEEAPSEDVILAADGEPVSGDVPADSAAADPVHEEPAASEPAAADPVHEESAASEPAADPAREESAAADLTEEGSAAAPAGESAASESTDENIRDDAADDSAGEAEEPAGQTGEAVDTVGEAPGNVPAGLPGVEEFEPVGDVVSEEIPPAGEPAAEEPAPAGEPAAEEPAPAGEPAAEAPAPATEKNAGSSAEAERVYRRGEEPEDDDDLSGISGPVLQQYLNEIDEAYEQRRAQRQKRMRRKKRLRRLRHFIEILILLAIAAFGAACVYIRKEDSLSFRLTEPWETYIHKLDPAEQKVEELIARTGWIEVRKSEEETEAPTEAPTEATEAATEAVTEAATEATEAPTEAPTEAAETTMKQETLDPEVASFFSGYSIDASDAPLLSDPDEAIVSTGAILVNLDTGEVVAQRGGETVISPASMTKILTVLVAAEHLTEAQLDDLVAEDQETSDFVFTNNCSIADLTVGEPVTVRDLFYGTILPSGGDAAMTLAKYVAGSSDAFVEMMNEKVEELGLSDTAHFTNCVGLYNEDLHCTLSDMAMILKAAVENDWCREVLSTHKYTTSATDTYPDGVELSNWFLRRIEDYDVNGEVRCAKTGFVNESGCCAASYTISDNGTHYICVTCNSTSSWQCIYDQINIYSTYLE